MNINTARGIAARIWCDQDYSNVIMNPDLAEKIAIMLMNEANGQVETPALASQPAKEGDYLFARQECSYMYCPTPNQCTGKCQHPKEQK
jgi:hypothetical protein